MVDYQWVWPVLALVVSVLANIGTVAYFLGGVRSDLRSLAARLDKVEAESKDHQTAYTCVDNRIRDLALVVAGMVPQMNAIYRHLDFYHLTGDRHAAKRQAAHHEEGSGL